MQLSFITEKISSLVWGNGTLLLILGTGIYLTIRLKFFQVRKFPKILQKTILSLFKPCKNPKDKTSSTQLQAISAALAASMGTGN
ncbi:MAG: sodium:alanine symporter family protein, partial [Ruminococcus sp.]|nr:sodium:alanine symporter family protein [Ruminococcus sp.]